MKTTITIELEVETGRLAVFAPLETTEQREMTAKILASAIQIALDHRPKKILTPNAPAGVLPVPPNGSHQTPS